jgi:NADH dehydrogenase/NADH:ubiquinone oxidoreductase subunit G
MTVKAETKLVTLKINNQDVTVPDGTTILEACQLQGMEVPNLCFQPLLRPWGSCRVCCVEILGRRGGIVESCAAVAREGMEVLTHSPAVLESRQFLLQMYLIDHALDCPTCDKSGECYLQDNTYL